MKRKPILAAITIVFFCAVFLSLCGCTAEIKPLEERFSAPQFPYTFVRSVETDKGEVTFYESGDSVRKFCHDEAGRVLIREESKVTYALNENGKCVSSGISYPAADKIANSVAMYAEDIDWEKNPDCFVEEVEDSVSNEPLLGTDFQGTIVNIVIFIAFADDTDTINESKVEGMFQGAGDSLSHYFNEVSNGKLQIKNLMPRESSRFFVYHAPNVRSYYYVGSSKTQERGKKEAELLTGAVAAAQTRFNTQGLNLDVNKDGYLDAVSFLVGGASSGDWGNLLWPHSWNLTTINNSYNNQAVAKIGGVKVGDFTFNFLDGLTTGVICHEFFHVLGAPDLYHYNYDFVPVGDWDVMQFNHATPQYPLAYMRETYLNGALGDAIGTVRHNGVYTLKPVTVAGKNDIVAYKIPTDRAGEYFMVEYRDPSRAVTYDRSLPSAGLIVYRIKEGVKEGNRNAKYQNAKYPDEVYVFRPRVASTGLETKDTVRYANSKEDLNHAAMSPANPDFSSVGKLLQTGVATKAYDYETLYYTNGVNSGIVIETLSMGRDGIAFSVTFSGGDTIDNTYFEDKISLSDGQFVNTETFSGVLAEVTFEEIDTSYLGGLEVKLYDDSEGVLATAQLSAGEFLARYAEGERTFPVRFVVNDKGNALTGVFQGGVMRSFSKPVRLTATAVDADGDSLEVAESVMGASQWSWEEILATRVEPTASVSAGNNLTVGVRTDGTVAVSGNRSAGQWAVSGMTNVVEASVGYSHTLVRTKDLKVSAAGVDTHGETAVAHWQNIRMIAAGYYVSYGVTLDGTVQFAGLDAYGLSAVTEWQGIQKISAGKYHVLGLTLDGRVLATGSNASGQCTLPKGEVVDIAAGRAFSAYLFTDGTVEVVGNLVGKEEIGAWKEVCRITAGENHLVGLTEDGRVLSVGDNAYRQCNVEKFVDVISVSASEYHTAVLRIDGKVEIAGGNPAVSLEISKNLIYDTNAYISVERITLNAETNLLYVGEETDLNVSFYPAMATYTRAIFSSNRPDVASVDPLTGRVTAKSEGRVTLRATDKGTGLVSAVTLDVYVLKDAVDVTFSEERIIISAGKSLAEALKFQPADATRFGELRVEVLNGGENLTATLYRPTDSIYQMVRLVAGENTGTFTLRLSYESPTGIKTHVAKVQIVSGITSIRLTETGRTEYRYGEPLEDGGTLEVTYDDGQTNTVFVNVAMLSYETVYMVGENRVRVTYMDKTTAFQITVYDYAVRVGISLTAPPKQSFLYGETPDFSEGKIRVHFAGGTSSRSVPLSDATVSNLNTEKVGEQTLTVSYEVSDPITGTPYLIYGNYVVTVEDTVRGIASALTQKSYRYGQPFTTTDLFTVEMASGEINTLEISESEVSGFDNTVLGTQTITIRYTDPATGKVFTAQDTVSVTLSGKLQIVGGDGGLETMNEQTFWYEIGAEGLGISVLILLDDGTGIEVETENGGNLWYELAGFSSDFEGAGQAVLNVFGKKLTENGIEDLLLYGPISLNTYGRSAIVRAYLRGNATVRYGETPEIHLMIELKSGETEDWLIDGTKLVYDPELVDVEQIIMTRYMMNEYVTGFLTVLDYGVELKIGGADEVNYGEEPQFYVEELTASGKTRRLSKDAYRTTYTVTDLKGELTVTYNGLTAKKVYEVTDLLTEMSAVGEWKVYYLYGEALRTDYTVRLKYKSGAVKELPFLSDDFRYHTDYQPTAGRYTVTLRCVNYDQELSYSVLVEDYVTSLTLNPPKEIEYGNPFECQITAVYAGGRKVNLSLSQVRCNFNPNVVGRQEVTVSYPYSLAAGNRIAEAVCVVYVTDEVLSVNLLQVPSKTTYRYGEAFSFYGGKIRVAYRSGTTVEYDHRSLALFEITYQPTRTGRQTVTLSVGGKSVTVAVSVRAETESTLKLNFPDGVNCDKKSGLVVTDTPMTAEEVLNCFAPADYLSVRISYENEGAIPTGTRIDVINENGVAVYAFRYVLKGDANGDGVFDFGDIQGLVNGYAQGALDSNLASVDGEEEVTLTDLVKWAKKATEKKSLPVNALGKNFIKAIRKGEEVYEERAV